MLFVQVTAHGAKRLIYTCFKACQENVYLTWKKIIRPLQCKQRHRLQRFKAITRMAFDLTLPIFNRTIYNPLPPTHLLLICLDTCWSLTSSFSHHIQQPIYHFPLHAQAFKHDIESRR